MERKCIERYQSYCKSLESLLGAKQRDMDDEFVLSGTVWKFSMTFDLAWKVMKDIVVKYHGLGNFASGSPRETLCAAADVGLTSDDKWMDMLTDRNNLIHDYDGQIALQKSTVILEEYIPLFVELKQTAAEYFQ